MLIGFRRRFRLIDFRRHFRCRRHADAGAFIFFRAISPADADYFLWYDYCRFRRACFIFIDSLLSFQALMPGLLLFFAAGAAGAYFFASRCRWFSSLFVPSSMMPDYADDVDYRAEGRRVIFAIFIAA